MGLLDRHPHARDCGCCTTVAEMLESIKIGDKLDAIYRLYTELNGKADRIMAAQDDINAAVTAINGAVAAITAAVPLVGATAAAPAPAADTSALDTAVTALNGATASLAAATPAATPAPASSSSATDGTTPAAPAVVANPFA